MKKTIVSWVTCTHTNIRLYESFRYLECWQMEDECIFVKEKWSSGPQSVFSVSYLKYVLICSTYNVFLVVVIWARYIKKRMWANTQIVYLDDIQVNQPTKLNEIYFVVGSIFILKTYQDQGHQGIFRAFGIQHFPVWTQLVLLMMLLSLSKHRSPLRNIHL